MKLFKRPSVKYYPPDSTALIFWLKNRKPKDWRDKIEHSGPDGGPLTVQIVKYGADTAAE